jgi:hypothetical protein
MVPSGNYWINNNIRIVDYEHYTHEGSLIEKSVK